MFRFIFPFCRFKSQFIHNEIYLLMLGLELLDKSNVLSLGFDRKGA